MRWFLLLGMVCTFGFALKTLDPDFFEGSDPPFSGESIHTLDSDFLKRNKLEKQNKGKWGCTLVSSADPNELVVSASGKGRRYCSSEPKIHILENQKSKYILQICCYRK